MCLIMMSGYPFSGKTTFVKLLIEKLEGVSVTHIDLKDWYLPEYDELSEEDKKSNGIAAWEMSLDVLDDAIKNKKEEHVIIYDTAAASLEPMLTRFKDAKWYSHKHFVFYVFLATTPEECEARAGNRWVGKEAIRYDFERFKNTVPRLKKEADRFFIVDNHDSPESLREYADKLSSEILKHGRSRIYQPQ